MTKGKEWVLDTLKSKDMLLHISSYYSIEPIHALIRQEISNVVKARI
jgi:hypothetical protein